MKYRAYSLFALFCLAAAWPPAGSMAQESSGSQYAVNKIEYPDDRELFTEDIRAYKDVQKKQIKKITAAPKGSPDLDVKSPNMEFNKDKNEVGGSGGILISSSGVRAEAQQGRVNLETKEADLSGDVLVTHSEGTVKAESGRFNVDSETGDFNNARFTMEEEGYTLEAGKVSKLSETRYKLVDAIFSTCNCDDGERPWYFKSDECDITQEGYAHSYGTKLHMFGMPVFYLPYVGFPAKTERSSGILRSSFGYGSEDGFLARVPVFIVFDESTDATITPFTATNTRSGSWLDFRKSFSRENDLESRFVYSDESARGDSLRGTDPTGVYDPTVPINRYGGYYVQNWTTGPESDFDAGLYSDVRLVSDDLFLREMEETDIADPQSRYTVSTVAARANIGDYVTAQLGGEYNQDFEVSENVVFQRLPEARLDAMKTFRPFGSNPLGIKAQTRFDAVATDFVRSSGYDGWRTAVGPSLSVPVRYKSYYNSAFNVGLSQAWYNLRDTFDPQTNTDLSSANSRTLPGFGYTASTAVERVYSLDKGNLLSEITSLGSQSQGNVLARVKHVVEPVISYNYVPERDQNDLPLFDSYDRVRARSLVTYGLNSSFLGRFLPRRGSEEIPELLPRPQDMPAFGTERALEDFGTLGDESMGGASQRRGEIRELFNFGVRQSYDAKIAQDPEENPGMDPFSDWNFYTSLYPTKSFGLNFDTNYNRYTKELDSWGLTTSLRDDRGDALRGRYTFVNNSISQLEGNAELALTSRLRVGYYARYDNSEHEFIEQSAALRLASTCDCWFFDIGYRDTINPDKQYVIASFTFGGLGDISQNVLYAEQRNSANQ